MALEILLAKIIWVSKRKIFSPLVAIALLFPLATKASTPQEVTHCQLLLQNYKDSNPTASRSFDQYQQPNARNLETYGKIFSTKLGKNLSKGSLAIDLGGGRGKAFYELAEQTSAHAVVINTQANNQIPQPKKGVFEYRQGWVEEVLPTFKGKAKLITDVWGAFSYSVKKIEILESIYTALEPGGEAYVLYHPNKTPAIVTLPNGRRVGIDEWLSTRYPKIFSRGQSGDYDTKYANTIKIVKPKTPTELKIALEVTRVESISGLRNTLPSIELRESSQH